MEKILLFSVCLLFIAGCKHSTSETIPNVPSDANSNATVTYDIHIQPLVLATCAITDCHNGKEEPTLLTYEQVKSTVRVGDPPESEFYESITAPEGDDDRMPPDKPLTEDQIKLVYDWIKQGAVETSQNAKITLSEACKNSTSKFVANVMPLVKAKCSSTVECHAAGSVKGPGALVSYDQIFKFRYSVHSSIAANRMPPENKLTADEKAIIVCWIENGALNN